jgi:hypothetical protein
MNFSAMPVSWAIPNWENTPKPMPDVLPEHHIKVLLSDIDSTAKWSMADDYQSVYCVVDDVHDINRYKNVLFGLTPNVILPKALEKYRGYSTFII